MCALLLTAAAGCTATAAGPSGSASPTDSDPSSVVAESGRVPVATPPPEARTPPVATERKLQLVAMGEVVRARLADADLLVTALGPSYTAPSVTVGHRPAGRVVGYVDVTATARSGSVGLAAGQFSSRDQRGGQVPLRPRGAAAATVTPGHPARFRLDAVFADGAAQITWRYRGRPLVVWDFTVELD